MATDLEGPSQPPLSCGKPKYIVVLLHDAGSNGDEVIGLAPEWAPILGKAEFLAPHAPWPVKSDDGGRQWLSPPQAGQTGDGYPAAAERLNTFIDAALARRKLTGDRLALVGFAQGAELALYAALRRERPLGAVVAIAGGLEPNRIGFDTPASKPPVLLVGAGLEPQAPESLEKMEQTLSEREIPVQKLENPGDYLGLDDNGIGLIADYLHRALVKADGDDHHH
ncbi:alpha/beta hydrolase [Methylococcus sp. EFPC2]|uniref:alpha/beta hydrolase n=1 Tax=Methylococcus sp. EFPC2 TaxID=2812648 RepID=UPI0019688E15|nr:dienelactone hydrolase family protein [Methylococcus sp. EFPC2]QSA97565.1 dienelactone hydrolase family protein [Methylococcus sp. EFPC2]